MYSCNALTISSLFWSCERNVSPSYTIPRHKIAVQVAYAWAMHLEVEEKKGPAARLAILRKMGLVDYAIDYATESGDFENAFALAEASKSTTKLPEIHLKHAMHLEVW